VSSLHGENYALLFLPYNSTQKKELGTELLFSEAVCLVELRNRSNRITIFYCKLWNTADLSVKRPKGALLGVALGMVRSHPRVLDHHLFSCWLRTTPCSKGPSSYQSPSPVQMVGTESPWDSSMFHVLLCRSQHHVLDSLAHRMWLVKLPSWERLTMALRMPLVLSERMWLQAEAWGSLRGLIGAASFAAFILTGFPFCSLLTLALWTLL
jgi:hypothetical protein